ncbi:MAG TPA: AbrB/MazE/SpoVT family DNA-binding domain-containing protein [Conexibacter sp.]|jgi:antitoxin PrlF|nr:AbrB/MazE/SpoVT family DNA-binding domain-containing protein [Conexibacter sp.]
MKSKISEKGQVTIPKPLRDQLGIRAGDELDFEAEPGRIVVTKVADQDPVDAVWGTLTLPVSVDEAIEQMRGPREP